MTQTQLADALYAAFIETIERKMDWGWRKKELKEALDQTYIRVLKEAIATSEKHVLPLI